MSRPGLQRLGPAKPLRSWRRAASEAGALVMILMQCVTGCALLHFPDVSGIQHHPSRYEEVLQPDQQPWIAFNVPVDRRSVEQLFSVRYYGEVVAGRYEWHGSRVLFIAEPGLISGRRYHMHFDGQFSDRSGRPHRGTILVPFYFASDDQQPPRIVSTSVEPGADLAPDSPLVMQFSVPMNRESVEQGLSLRPESEIRPDWNADATVLTLHPRKSWPHAVPMTLSLDAECHSAAGLPLERRYRLTVQVIANHSRPRVEAIEAIPADVTAADPFAAAGVELRDRSEIPGPRSAIRVTFSAPMEQEPTERAFLLSPTSAGTFHWPEPNVMVFVPAQIWRPEEEHLLAITDRASGRYGNRLEAEVSLRLQRPVASLEIQEIRLPENPTAAEIPNANKQEGETVPQPAVLTDMTDFAAVDITPGLPPHYPYTLVLKFSAPFDTDRRKLGVLDSLSLTSALPGSCPGPFVVGYGWIDDLTLSVTFHEVRPSTAAGRNYLILTVRGGPSGIAARDELRLAHDARQLFVVREEM